MTPGPLQNFSWAGTSNWACSDMGTKDVVLNPLVYASRYTCISDVETKLYWFLRAFYRKYSDLGFDDETKTYEGVYVEDPVAQLAYFDKHVLMIGGEIALLPLEKVPEKMLNCKCKMSFVQPAPGVMMSVVVMFSPGRNTRNHLYYMGYLVQFKDKYLMQSAINLHYCAYAHLLELYQFRCTTAVFSKELDYLRMVCFDTYAIYAKQHGRLFDFRVILKTPKDKGKKQNQIAKFAALHKRGVKPIGNSMPEFQEELKDAVDYYNFLNNASRGLSMYKNRKYVEIAKPPNIKEVVSKTSSSSLLVQQNPMQLID